MFFLYMSAKLKKIKILYSVKNKNTERNNSNFFLFAIGTLVNV